jgi:hypothetical protein
MKLFSLFYYNENLVLYMKNSRLGFEESFTNAKVVVHLGNVIAT